MTKHTLKKQIDFILATQESTRNSDIELSIQLWSHFYPEKVFISDRQRPSIALSDLFDLPTQDNIKRIRAEIQNVERRYLPTDDRVFAERARLSVEWKKLLGYNATWKFQNWLDAIVEFRRPSQSDLFGTK